VLVIVVATAFPEKQLLGILWQIKKQYSCCLFDFVGADHYFIRIANLPSNVVSDGLHSQKQCKYFLFNY
jgi:hypothetical protein